MNLFSGNKMRVIVPREEIAAFNRQWPCSTLRDRAYWFGNYILDSRNGIG